MKQITPAQHLKASTTSIVSIHRGTGEAYEYERFTKPLETQSAAIKRYEAARKRALKPRERRNYPNTTAALKSTESYVREFYSYNALGTPPFNNLSKKPTTWPEGPEFEFTEVDPLTEFEELVESYKDLI